MKWIGQHIWDLTSRFRNDVYLEDLTEVEQEFTIQVAADGKLTKSTAPSERSRIQVRNDEGSVIPAGAPLYSKGEIGGSNRIKVGICVSSDPAKMPCIGIAEFEMNTSNTKDSFAITQGVYNTSISGFTGLTEGDILYVNGGVAPHLTPTKPTNGSLIQNVGIVLKAGGGGTICQGLLVSAIGRTNDVPWPLYVDHATQRVGIGTTSPSSKLDVQGEIKSDKTANGVSFSSTGGGLTFTAFDVYTATNGGLLRLYNESTQTVNIDGRSSSGNTYFNNGGNVGIGTTSPTSKLHVIGDARIQGNLTVNGTYTQIDTDVNTTEQWLVTNDGTGPAAVINQLGTEDIFDVQDDGTSVFYIEDGGNVGIGTTSPAYKLSVNGDVQSDFFRGYTYPTGSYLDFDEDTLPGTNGTALVSISSMKFMVDSNNNSTSDAFSWIVDGLPGSGTTLMTLLDEGYLGIGTTSPVYELDIDGQARIQSTNYEMLYLHQADANGGFIKFTNTDDTDGWYAGISGSEEFIISRTADNSAPIITAEQNGRVGIGTSSPTARLHVESVDDAVIKLKSTDNKAYIVLSDNDTNGYISSENGRLSLGPSTGVHANNLNIDLSSNNVGIGTTSPGGKLDVAGDTDARVILGRAKFDSYVSDYLYLSHFDQGSATNYALNQSSAGSTSINAPTGQNVALKINNSPKLQVQGATGNVGIGTTSPSEKLEVSGNIKLSGNLDIGGSVQKQIQVFPMNFVDDLGTDKHFMPFVTNTEQTVVYQEEAAMVMPADGRVVSVTVHYAQMDGTDGNITVGIETSACGQSYANPWTVEETETIAASVTDDHHVFHFAFDNAKHFESTDKMAISIQQSTDMQSAARFFWVTAVIEYDWSTFLGGTSAEYTTTP